MSKDVTMSSEDTSMSAAGPAGPGNAVPPYEAGPGASDSFFGAANTGVYVDDTSTYADSDRLDSDGDELDAEFAPQPRRRLGKLTVLLAALLVAGGGFLAGVQVQKHQPVASAASAFAAAAARRGTGAGAGAGGFGGFGGTGTGAGGTRTGAGGGTGTGGGTGGSGTSTGPAVIGQIVSITGDTVIVKNLGGKMITVKLSSDTTVTQSSTASALKAGQTVTVSGTTGADGTVTATTVGARQ
jgi:Domain of unknown function (DUF5666)